MGSSAAGSGFLVAFAFTSTSWGADGFWTAAAGGDKRPKLLTKTRIRKAARLVTDTLAVRILTAGDWDKDFLQGGKVFPLCVGRTEPASYVGPYGLVPLGTWAYRREKEGPGVCKLLL